MMDLMQAIIDDGCVADKSIVTYRLQLMLETYSVRLASSYWGSQRHQD